MARKTGADEKLKRSNEAMGAHPDGVRKSLRQMLHDEPACLLMSGGAQS
jgi:hypothetical protein